MNPEVMKERLDKLFSNNPAENLDLLPSDTQSAIANAILDKVELCLIFISLDECAEIAVKSVLFGIAGQAFFAGHNYAVEHGNLMAEMNKV